jgi:serine/threonine protein kinase
MPLSAGDKLGPYEILALIGAGGMGEVYRAKDTRLGREVAIKPSRENSASGSSAKRKNDAVRSAVHVLKWAIWSSGPVRRASQAERPKSRITLRGLT